MFIKKADAEGADIELSNEAPADSTPTNVPGQVAPLTETTNEALTAKKGADKSAAPREPREPRERKQRGPPEDGVPSKTKVMVANLPYDLKEDRVRSIFPLRCGRSRISKQSWPEHFLQIIALFLAKASTLLFQLLLQRRTHSL
jgi:hypothetical protein